MNISRFTRRHLRRRRGDVPHGRLGLSERSDYPEESRSFRARSIKLYAPVAALLGGGVRSDFPRRVAFRADAQVAMLLYLPVAAHVSASLTIPFGPSRPDAAPPVE